MSPLTQQLWLDAWGHLSSAQQSYKEAKTVEERERALADMYALSDSFKASCLSFLSVIGYDKIVRNRDV